MAFGNRGGRKPTPGGPKYSDTVTVNMTSTQYAWLQKYSRLHFLNLGEAMRALINEEMERDRTSTENALREGTRVHGEEHAVDTCREVFSTGM